MKNCKKVKVWYKRRRKSIRPVRQVFINCLVHIYAVSHLWWVFVTVEWQSEWQNWRNEEDISHRIDQGILVSQFNTVCIKFSKWFSWLFRSCDWTVIGSQHNFNPLSSWIESDVDIRRWTARVPPTIAELSMETAGSSRYLCFQTMGNNDQPLKERVNGKAIQESSRKKLGN